MIKFVYTLFIEVNLNLFYFAGGLFVATILLIVTFTNRKSSPVIDLPEYKPMKKSFLNKYILDFTVELFELFVMWICSKNMMHNLLAF